MTYEPLDIEPFQTGLDTALDPRLIPPDGFQVAVNCHIHHGKVQKREGFRKFGEMVHGDLSLEISGATQADPVVITVTGAAITAITQSNPAVVTATNTFTNGDIINIDNVGGMIEVNGLSFTVANRTTTDFELAGIDSSFFTLYTAGGDAVLELLDGERVQINSVIGMTELNGGEFTVTNLTITTFSLQDLEGVDIDGTGFALYVSGGTISIFPMRRIMGLFRYITSGNLKTLLAFDDRRAAVYDSNSDSFIPLINSVTGELDDIFSSSDIDYIWTENWASTSSSTASTLFRLYFTNGLPHNATTAINGIWFYSSLLVDTAVLFRPQINGVTFINGCQLIFAMKQRLVLLNTTEGATEYPQRARWSQIQNPDSANTWDDNVAGKGGFVDAPTGDQIISARPLQDGLIVFMTDSVWTLRPVPDPALPFRWDKINDFRSCDSKVGTTQYDRYVLCLGQRGITATDGVETRRIDDKIEDFVTDVIDSQNFDKTYALRSHAHKRGWALFSKSATDSNESDAALIYDEQSASYTTYDISMNVLGYGAKDLDYSASDFTAANDLDVAAQDLNEETASSFSWQIEAELFIGGDINGVIYQLETEGDDEGKSIALELQSTSWAPYKEQGIESQFGYIDLLIDTDQETTFTVEFFKDNNEVPYPDPFTGITAHGADCLPNLNYITDVVNVVPKSPITDGFTVSAPKHGLSTGDLIFIYGVGNINYVNDAQFDVTVIDEDTFDVEKDLTTFGAVITGITQANPAFVTADNDFIDGQQITIVDVVGMTEVNGGIFTVANALSTSFELEGVDSTGFTAYISDGVAIESITDAGVLVEKEFYRTKTWKRIYAGGYGYQHSIRITTEGIDKPFTIHAWKPYFRPRGRRTI